MGLGTSEDASFLAEISASPEKEIPSMKAVLKKIQIEVIHPTTSILDFVENKVETAEISSHNLAA